jgi:hypothetical protein
MTAILSGLHILLALQAPQAAVAGSVRDAATGEPLQSAEVVLTDLDRVAFTDSSGRYMLRAVPAGPQHIAVRVIGYGQRTLHALVPSTGQLEINFSLRPEPIPLTQLSVRTRVPMRGAEHDDDAEYPERGASIAAIRNHPQLAEPDVLQALAGGDVVLTPESPNGVHVRGAASDQTAYTLDGIPVFNPYHAGGLFSAWNPDALSSIQLASSIPSPALPAVLGGVVTGVTRTPGARMGVQGSISSTQARVSADGPLGSARAGYLLSLRSSYPSLIAPHDASYLTGESADVLAKLEAPAFGGRIHVIAYDSEDEIDAAATPETQEPGLDPQRNVFEWHSSSLGASFVRAVARVNMRLQLWRASADANVLWLLHSGATASMSADREEDGVLIALERNGATTTTSGGLRAVRTESSYRLATDDGTAPLVLHSNTPLAAGFVDHTRTLMRTTRVKLATSLTAADGAVHLSPRAQLRWSRSGRLALTASIARLHQFGQSVRNAESIVGNIFPVDLQAGVSGTAVPVARSDVGVLAGEYRPSAGVRLGAQVYQRASQGLLLIAPREVEPFATGDLTIGSSMARGLSFDFAMSASRYGLIASYGWQRTRFEYADSGYTPDFAAAHVIDAGIIVFPTATSSIRLGATAALGRRATTVAGGFEWESCNLLDRGCEFVGSPRLGIEPIGATALPAYVRVDLGLRKHWHLAIAGRDASVALFGTVTNLFARNNVLNYAVDPDTGERAAIEMRPWSPLVVGLDYRF